MTEGSITGWFGPLRNGDEDAVAAIYERYFDRLVAYARRQLESVSRRDADEEDVALSALNCFAAKAADNQFPDLQDRTDLWKLLLTFTMRKAADERKRQSALKRGGNQVRGDSIFRTPAGERSFGWEAFSNDEPTPESIAGLNEQLDVLLASLDDSLREVASLRIQAFSVNEVAERLGCTKRTVIRKLNRIRERWTELLKGDDG